jgi:hypothetical protein
MATDVEAEWEIDGDLMGKEVINGMLAGWSSIPPQPQPLQFVEVEVTCINSINSTTSSR